MIFHPAIIGLFLSSILIGFMVLYCAFYGIRIVRRWDILSGSELQLTLERRTYLLSTFLSYIFGCQLLSLFLFIFTADELHPFFVGAMCAAGSLYANAYGYPVLLLKILNFFMAGLWLILNHADNQASDYPLIRKKYVFLLVLAPLILAEAMLQAAYFINLNPSIITSCCGTLFSTEGAGISADIGALPGSLMKTIFFGSMTATLASGIYFFLKGKNAWLFAGLSAIHCVISLLSILSFISLYIYELPTHHCPFCILQKEYGYVGYPLYMALFAASILGVGVGFLMPFRNIRSLSETIPATQKRMALAAVVLFTFFAMIVIWKMVSTDFILEG
ncbi:MAG TPA: hypothetical protein VLR91_00345 [Thermodesulfobacteriota bacterium]|nr:hypothetical protein [Thermodesulfobacteriota bacterium]